MIIFPAIDIKDGQCVRLKEGKFEETEIFSNDPVMMALKWMKKGAQFLHVVDLDGARFGKLSNLSVIKNMVKKIDIPIQVGGGIRKYEEVERLIELGVERIILGTILWKDKVLAERLFQTFPEKIIAGIDAKEGHVAIDGWQSVVSVNAFDFALEMESLGARHIIYTDIKRDGMMMGPNIVNIGEMLKKINISLIASGGVTSLSDIRDLKNLADKNLEGIIIGKALYKGTISLEEAIKLQ